MSLGFWCICTCARACMYGYMCVCVCTYMCTCVYVYARVCVHARVEPQTLSTLFFLIQGLTESGGQGKFSLHRLPLKPQRFHGLCLSSTEIMLTARLALCMDAWI